MKERLFTLRKEVLNLSREKFGRPVGMSDSEIKNVEYGITDLKDAKITLICKEYGVSEKWLRTGEGAMLQPKSRGDEIADIVNSSMRRTPQEARDSLIAKLQTLTDAEIQLLAELISRME